MCATCFIPTNGPAFKHCSWRAVFQMLSGGEDGGCIGVQRLRQWQWHSRVPEQLGDRGWSSQRGGERGGDGGEGGGCCVREAVQLAVELSLEPRRVVPSDRRLRGNSLRPRYYNMAPQGSEAQTAPQPITLEEELSKNPELRKDQIDLLRDWAHKQPHLPQVLDRELALFLHSCYYSVEAAKVTLDTYFTARTHLPDFFANRDASRDDVAQAAKLVCMVPLPSKTPEGYKVIFCHMVDEDPSHFVHHDVVKVFFMMTDLLLREEGTAPGHVIIMDMAGISLAHVARLSIVTYKKFFYYLQEGLPFRLKGLHFINVVPFMDKIMAMMRPFMNKEIQEMLNLYTEETVEQMYKYVPKEILPKNYGGNAPTHLQLHEHTLPWILANKEYFCAEEKRVVQEGRRPGKARSAGDLFGVEGSFKKLDID